MRGAGPELSYDFAEWSRLCKSPLFGGPSMCLSRAYEPIVADVEPRVDNLDDPAGKPLGYS